MQPSELVKSSDWVLRLLSDGSAVVYNPHSGDLHALSEFAATVVEKISDGRASFVELIDSLVVVYPDVDREELLRESEFHVSSLTTLGVISRLADPISTSTASLN